MLKIVIFNICISHQKQSKMTKHLLILAFGIFMLSSCTGKKAEPAAEVEDSEITTEIVDDTTTVISDTTDVELELMDTDSIEEE